MLAIADLGEPRRRCESRGHAFEHGAKLRVADVAQAVPQFGGYGFQHGWRLNGRGGRDLPVRHADGGDRGIAEEAVDRGDDVGRDMLEHRRVRAADRQVQRPARLLPRGKADHRGLGDVGEAVADDLAPAADHRRLDEAELAKGGAADFGDEVGNRARLAAARALVAARGRLGGLCARLGAALRLCLFGGGVVSRGFRHTRRHAIGGG